MYVSPPIPDTYRVACSGSRMERRRSSLEPDVAICDERRNLGVKPRYFDMRSIPRIFISARLLPASLNTDCTISIASSLKGYLDRVAPNVASCFLCHSEP